MAVGTGLEEGCVLVNRADTLYMTIKKIENAPGGNTKRYTLYYESDHGKKTWTRVLDDYSMEKLAKNCRIAGSDEERGAEWQKNRKDRR